VRSSIELKENGFETAVKTVIVDSWSVSKHASNEFGAEMDGHTVITKAMDECYNSLPRTVRL
jgi:hypothetical protein